MTIFNSCRSYARDVVALLLLATPLEAQPPLKAVFSSHQRQSTNEGHVALGWSCGNGAETPDGVEYELQSARRSDFASPKREYLGVDNRSFQSGLPNGHFFYRIRARSSDDDTWGPWSDAVEVVCEHHSMTLAWALFASGGVMFLCIAIFVGVNSRSLERFEHSYA